MESARPSSIRVLLVDDHQLLTDCLARLLEAEPDISVVGSVRSFAELIGARQPRFDVVLMDYLLPDGNGADATRAVKKRWPHARVIILSALIDDHAVARATRAGADAYLGKETAASTLVDAVRATQSSSQSVASTPGPTTTASRTGSASPAADSLTPRERQVLRALTLGRSTRDICLELGIAPNTVRSHVQNLIGKLHVHSRLEAVSLAVRDRLV